MKRKEILDALTPDRFAMALGSIGCRKCSKRYVLPVGFSFSKVSEDQEFLTFGQLHLMSCWNVGVEAPSTWAERQEAKTAA